MRGRYCRGELLNRLERCVWDYVLPARCPQPPDDPIVGDAGRLGGHLWSPSELIRLIPTDHVIDLFLPPLLNDASILLTIKIRLVSVRNELTQIESPVAFLSRHSWCRQRWTWKASASTDTSRFFHFTGVDIFKLTFRFTDFNCCCLNAVDGQVCQMR